MRFSLSPHQLVAHWVPGFILVGIILFSDLNTVGHGTTHLEQLIHVFGAPLAILTLSVVAFAIGEFLDGVRNLFEEFMCWCVEKQWCDKKCAIKWDFIWKLNPHALKTMEQYYFTYYVFGFNMAEALFFGTILVESKFFSPGLPHWMLILIGVVFLVFAFDAYFLRRDIAKETHEPAHRR